MLDTKMLQLKTSEITATGMETTTVVIIVITMVVTTIITMVAAMVRKTKAVTLLSKTTHQCRLS